ncbi:MAG: DUF998 domain-containing protein [Terracidiphilus sp.]
MTMDHGSQKTRSRSASLMLLAGGGGILFIATFVVLGFLTPGYSSLYDTISALESTPFKLAQQINFSVFGALLCVFALGLRREMQQGFGAVLIPSIQFLDGLGVIGDAIFVRSAPHLACDLVAFNAALCVLFLFAWRFRLDPRWRGWTAYSILTAIAMMILLFGFGVANHLGGPAGLMEKLTTIVRTTWSVLLVKRLLAETHPAFTPNRPAATRF